jgi:hypothetical protein
MTAPDRSGNNTRRAWTDAERAILRRNYAHFPTAQIAAQLGRTLAQVYNQAAKLGLHKSAEYLASPAACRMRRGDLDRLGGAAHRFKPGHEPWNKGTHYTAGGRSAETRFKPGRAPEQARNYRPIGSLRISKDGTLERKVTDDQAVVPARRWVGVHRLVWEQQHGPVPPGHAVAFRAGRRTTDPALITPDALELITRAELMARNTVHTLPKPLAQLVQLRGALKRQINRRQRATEDQTT